MSDPPLTRRCVVGRDKPGHDDRARAGGLRAKDSTLLPDAQSRKDLSEHIFNADPPDNLVHREGRATKILGDQFRLRRFRLERRSQRLACVLKPVPMSLKRQHSRLTRRHALFG